MTDSIPLLLTRQSKFVGGGAQAALFQIRKSKESMRIQKLKKVESIHLALCREHLSWFRTKDGRRDS